MNEQLASGHRAVPFAGERTVWEYLKGLPHHNELFLDMMHGVTTQTHVKDVVESIPIGDAVTVMDIAGGVGGLGCALAQNFPINVVVCDQPENAERASEHIRMMGVTDRCNFVGVDMFDSVPAGGDLYLIKHALHDWADDQVVVILKNIARSMRSDSRLLIIEGLLDEHLRDNTEDIEFMYVRDLEQRICTFGRVRSIADFELLACESGLKITGISHSRVVDISYIECQRL
ncbi:MAG: hypothetical protein FGM40_07890 [Rhodocyclaceae bacterium]|nr:hypothetical protein [Rhodocyclaceae bacterium]